jgi:hypothetical protein
MKLPKSSVERVASNFATAELGDPRRTKRVVSMVSKLAQAPAASLPAAMGSTGDIEAAYRLANNRNITFDELLASVANATQLKAEVARQVLVIHDTTDASFSHLSPEEIGYLQTGKAGFKLHLSLVLDASSWRRPLGVIHAETLHRMERARRGGRKKLASGIQTAKWQDREFLRWWRGVRASAKALQRCERVIHVADRESDAYELMAQTLATGQGFIFRVRVDRRSREMGAEHDAWSTVKQVAAGCQGRLERTVPLSRREGKRAPGMNKGNAPRDMRWARLEFAATTIEIPRPRYVAKNLPEVLRLNLVCVTEPDPPEAQQPVQWLLYTTEPVETKAQVEEVVDRYRARWTIEEFNSALKTGTAYEARQFETRHALLTMLALSLPIACEMLWLRSRARATPDAPATEVLTQRQIDILREMGPRTLSARPTAQEALAAVAALGGHLKNNGDPGWKILNRAMSLMHAYEAAWTAAERRFRGADL